LVERVTSTARS